MSRAWPLAIAASFTAGLALGCADRRLDEPADDNAEMPACLVIWGYGGWDDGRVHVIVDDEGSPTVCQCMTEDELHEVGYLGSDEAFIPHEINQRAFEECKRAASLYDFDWDPCQEYYETGEWRASLGWTTTEETAWKNRDGLTCGEGEGDELGCALSGRQSSLAWLVMLAGLFGLRRRHAFLADLARRHGLPDLSEETLTRALGSSASPRSGPRNGSHGCARDGRRRSP